MTDSHCLPCTLAAFSELSAEILCLGKSIRFEARGSSMDPLLRDGDILLVEPVKQRLLRVGEVVICSNHSGNVIVHRVLRRQVRSDGAYYLVQGDQALQPDGWIPQGKVYGRVRSIDRGNTHINMRNLLLRLLGMVAVLRSRGQIGRNGINHFVSKIARQLPLLNDFLS